MKYSTAILILLSIFFSSCRPSKDCPKLFEIPAKIHPYQETYQIGDTIMIHSKFHSMVYELSTERKYEMKDIQWSPGLGIFRIDDDSSAVISLVTPYFDFIENEAYKIATNSYSDGSTTIEGEYNLAIDTFSLSITIVPKEVGIFFLGYGSGLVNSRQDFPGRCRSNGFSTVTRLNGEADNNIHLLKESPNPHYNEWFLGRPQERFHDRGGFCFRVIE